MQICEKYDKSRSPSISSVEEFEVFNAKVDEWRQDVRSGALWMSITDAEKEGEWVDWYTGDIINITHLMVGGVTSIAYRELSHFFETFLLKHCVLNLIFF